MRTGIVIRDANGPQIVVLEQVRSTRNNYVLAEFLQRLDRKRLGATLVT